MKEQINTPSSKERFVQAQYIKPDGTIETYSNYMVSDRGRVGSLVDRWGKRSVMKIMKPTVKGKLGYLGVGLYGGGKCYFRFIHRIVLSSFHPEQYIEGTEVDHIDRCPTNNRLSNLHWIDKNGNYANRSTCSLKKIRVTYLCDGHTEEFDSMYDCSRAFGKSLAWCINMIRKCNGFNAKHNILIEKI